GRLVRTARVAAYLALAIGIVLGVLILFGPFYSGCTTGAVAPGQTPGPETCTNASLVEVQRDQLFPAPLLWIIAWTLAPALAVIGVWMHERGRSPGTLLIVVALLLVMTGIISLGGGFLFALTEGPLLLLALIAARRATPRQVSPS